MCRDNKINKVLDNLINIRYFANIVNKKASDDLDKKGISCGESFYLMLLNNYDDGLTMSELSSRMKVDKSLTTRTMKSLLEKEYIYKDTKNLNSRNYKIKLTDKGIECADDISNIFIKKYDSFISNFTDKEIKMLEQTCALLMDKCNSNL